MYAVSSEYTSAINKNSRKSRIEGILTLTDDTVINISDKDIMQGSLSIDNSCVNGQDMHLGSVYVGQCKVSLNTEINRYKLYGSKIKFSYFLNINGDNEEEIPLGEYVVDDAIRNGKYVNITAYDNMTKFDTPFTLLTTGTPYELLKLASTTCGVELSQTEEEIRLLSPVSTEGAPLVLSVKEGNSLETFRDLISDVSVILGGFATIDRYGKLRIKRFGESTVIIPETNRKRTEISDFLVRYTGVKAFIKDKEFAAGDDVGRVVIIENNLWDVGTDAEKQLILDNIFKCVETLVYTPTTVSYFGDPAIDLGDKIIYTGGDAGNDGIVTLITTTNFTHKGLHKLISVGSNPLLATAKNKSEKNVTNINHTIEQNSTKTLVFQSSEILNIGNEPVVICHIESRITGTNVISFMGQAIVNVTKPGTFKIKYELNEEEMIFSPAQIASYEGPYIINLFHPFSLAQSGQAVFKVYLFSEDGGEAIIDTGSVLSTISGTDIGSDKEGSWNGITAIRDTYTLTYIGEIELTDFTEKIDIAINEPKEIAFSDTIEIFEIGGFDIFDFDAVITQN